MTLTERAAAAAELKTTGQCNCTQSVVKVFEDKLPVEGDTLRMLAAGYAAGMGCMESTCGALIGAVMVAGILWHAHWSGALSSGAARLSAKSLRALPPACRSAPAPNACAMPCWRWATYCPTP